MMTGAEASTVSPDEVMMGSLSGMGWLVFGLFSVYLYANILFLWREVRVRGKNKLQFCWVRFGSDCVKY
jgi:hypothetical protein